MPEKRCKADISESYSTSTLEENPLFRGQTDDVIRPPRPPESQMGPYLQFLTTDLEKMLWVGSILIFRQVGYEQPVIKFKGRVKVDYDWEVLYENIFDMRAYRINLNIELPQGTGDEKVEWMIDWGKTTTNGHFYIACYNQKWRGAFFSCNGFDATVSQETASGLKYDLVWNHLLSVHEENPFHLLLWGGDQNYNDFVIEDVPCLQEWSQLNWENKWTYQCTDQAKRDIEQYYFNNYAEHWERRWEMKKALTSIPSLMMWDDHDIFDGAGSYTPIINESPVITDLFHMAQKMRLLFQHHTTPEKVRQHRLFGYLGHNFLTRCGPHLALLGTDGRTERNDTTVHHEKTWDLIFEKLNDELRNVKHLIVLFAVPFTFIRFKMGESLLETWKKFTMRFRNISVSQCGTSVFGLPEIYDDLLDEWTHENHLEERNRVLCRFQEFARSKKTRVTFFSGDVHCCGVGRFKTTESNHVPIIRDHKLMYQIVSSAIVNKPPANIVIRGTHLFAQTWYPVDDTEEAFIDFFERSPERTSRLILRKLLPNRNWCQFEQCTNAEAVPMDYVVHTRFIDRFVWPLIEYLLLLIGLGCILNYLDRKNTLSTAMNRGQDRSLWPSDRAATSEQEPSNLRIRFWLENSKKKRDMPPFASYELVVPDLK